MTAGFLRAAHAEWTKLRSVRATGWSLLAVFGLTTVLTAVVCGTNSTSGCPPGADCEDTVQLTLSGTWFGQLVVVAFGGIVITSEYATGMVRATFAASPRRRTVLAAKAAVLAAVVLGVGLVTSFASFFLGRSILPGSGFTADHGYPPLSLGDGPTLRAVIGTALYFAALALLALGVGAILRHTIGAVTAALGLLFGPLLVFTFLPETVGEYVQKLSPMAGLAIQQTAGRQDWPIGPWPGLGVLCVYAATALLVGFALITRRDA